MNIIINCQYEGIIKRVRTVLFFYQICLLFLGGGEIRNDASGGDERLHGHPGSGKRSFFIVPKS